MSWSVGLVGRRKGVVASLEKYGAALTGSSKAEFAQAMPALVILVNMNYHNGGKDPVLQLDANGHAWEGDSTVNASVRRIGELCEEPK